MNKNLIWVLVLVIIVILGGAAYSFYGHSSEQGEMHEEGAMMQDQNASSSDSMMHEATDTIMASSSDTMMHATDTMMAH